MNFELTDEQNALIDEIRLCCDGFPDEYWAACDSQERFPTEFHQAMAATGWLGVTFPPEYGGKGRGMLDAILAIQEIAASGAGVNGCIPVHMPMASLDSIVRYGSEELKREIIPDLISGRKRFASLGVTEPEAGSDTSRTRVRATRSGSEWTVSGTKVWITQAMEAEHALLVVRTGDAVSGRFDGISLLLIDLAEADGLRKRPIPKLGANAVSSCELTFENFKVDQARLIGEEGKGFEYLLSSMNPARFTIAAEAVGIGRAALRRATAHAKEREVFGRPIGTNQAISHPLADSYARLEAAWQMALLAAWRHDHDLPCAAQAHLAKYLATEAAFEAANRAVQTLGGQGYGKEYHVERYFREARLLSIAPVTQEMTLNFLAGNVLGLPKH